MSYFLILGSVLGVFYTLLTTPKKDFKEMDRLVITVIILVLIIASWGGLVTSIAADVVTIKKKLTD